MTDATTSPSARSSGWAKAIDAWIMVAGKALVVGLCAVAITEPQWLPRFSQLIDSLGDVDFAGVKLHFDKDAAKELAKHGVVFQNDKMFVGGHDIDDIVADSGKLQSQIQILSDQNQTLTASLTQQGDLLKQAQAQLSAGGGGGPTPSVAVSADLARANAAAATVVSQSQAVTKNAVQVAADLAAKAPQNAGFGIVFSSDQDKPNATALDQAMVEVKKVEGFFPPDRIALYRRGKFLASVARFDTRDQSLAALPEFTSKLTSGPFAVNLGSWCPQPSTVAPAAPPTPEQKSCGF